MSYKEYTVKVYDDGTVYWFNEEGQFNLEDGPAVTKADGTRFWYRNSKLHRTDGPAVIHSSGRKEFWLNGIFYSEKDYWEKLKPAKEMTIAELEKELGYKIKVVKG